MTATTDREIVAVLPSLYFHPAAEVLVTTCGHRHLRPTGMRKQGEMLHCPFCEDDPDAPPHDPWAGVAAKR